MTKKRNKTTDQPRTVISTATEGHVKAIVLKTFEGQAGTLFPKDVIELPERRFKTLSARGFVKEAPEKAKITAKR